MDTAAQSKLVQDQLADPQTNVLNGEPFGTGQTAAVDMASLFSIDTDQLESAFSSTPGKLDLDLSDGSVDFSSLIDLDSFQFDRPKRPTST